MGTAELMVREWGAADASKRRLATLRMRRGEDVSRRRRAVRYTRPLVLGHGVF